LQKGLWRWKNKQGRPECPRTSLSGTGRLCKIAHDDLQLMQLAVGRQRPARSIRYNFLQSAETKASGTLGVAESAVMSSIQDP
jgi:hypothetical protein